MFGEVRKEMNHTYKNIARLYSQLGDPKSAEKYLNMSQELMEKQKVEGDLTEEQRIAMLED